MTLGPLTLRFPTREDGHGKVGYLLVRGDPSGAWRITTKDYDEHDLVASCDLPEALLPAVRDHMTTWLMEMFRLYRANVEAVSKCPAQRPGFRADWRERAINDDRRQWARACRSARRTYCEIVRGLRAAGWPVDQDELIIKEAA